MTVERAVVTGGAGFVGSAVAEALAGLGTSVLVVDDLSTGTASNLDRSCLVDVRRSVAEPGPDAPVPLAEGLRRTLGWIRSR
jgi:NAD(P)-dependent dehydrogenase (short-subunit alcohol dehydrogenase family)